MGEHFLLFNFVFTFTQKSTAPAGINPKTNFKLGDFSNFETYSKVARWNMSKLFQCLNGKPGSQTNKQATFCFGVEFGFVYNQYPICYDRV